MLKYTILYDIVILEYQIHQFMLRNAFAIHWMTIVVVVVAAYSCLFYYQQKPPQPISANKLLLGSVLWRFSGILVRCRSTNGHVKRWNTAGNQGGCLLPVDAAPPDLTVVSCCPSLRANLTGGWHFWHCGLSENLNFSVDCRPLGLEKNDWKISLTGSRLDSLFSQRVSRKSDAHLLLKWDVPNLNSMVVWDVAVNIKWYKSPHPGMSLTGMQPALLITLPANQQRLLSETLINQEQLMQNKNTPLCPFLLLRSQFHILLTPSYEYLVNLDKS